ncbi:EAL domain-containing protein, partial [Klebsiella pneumoniae]|nr:EAL domain-containing protein [Klebsiella pneumoniae]
SITQTATCASRTGCFVRDILTDPLDAIMVKSIVEMARAKQMSVVAEYVESEPQKAPSISPIMRS